MVIEHVLNHPNLGDGLVRLIDETRVPSGSLAQAAREILGRYGDHASDDGVGKDVLLYGLEHGEEALGLLQDAGVLLDVYTEDPRIDVRYLLRSSKLEAYLSDAD